MKKKKYIVNGQVYEIPDDESTQIEVTFINVPAGAVVIPIPITLVYDENTGTPSEWNTSTNLRKT